MSNNLFNFSRPLPLPFSMLPNKKVKVSSIYGSGTEATLCASVLKALNAICGSMSSKFEGAVGKKDHRCMAEYKSSISPSEYHLAVYDSTSGNIMASVYDKNTELMENYVLHQTKRDGAVVIMAMFPTLMEEGEFEEKFKEYYGYYKLGFPDITKAAECAGILCDNAYRRITDNSCSANVKANVDTSGNLVRITTTHLDSGTFTPENVVAGEFTIFANMKSTEPLVKAKIIMEREDFEGNFKLHERTFNETEHRLIPKLPEWYVIPKEVVDICKHAQSTTKRSTPMRNFLLRGPAGTGKTMATKAIAAGLGLPYMKYTCSAGTEIYDFIGQIFPESDTSSTGNAILDKEREELKTMGGITYKNVMKLLSLPDVEDIDYDPIGVYKTLTGTDNPKATTQDCMSIIMDKVTEKVKALSHRENTGSEKGQSFSYIETDFIKALKNGYVVEIQEPTTIVQPGVLVGLNSLLEQEGSITLPTGEVVERHPDAVVVVTTNVSYEGCRGMNQSIIDRMSLVKDVELPTPEVMVQRAMSVTGAVDETEVTKMVQVVNDMAEYCRKNSISDGNVGMRSLIDWIVSSEITGDIYESALSTIISKATSDEADRETLISAVLEPMYVPKRARRAV